MLRKLDESEAMAVAVAWKDELRGCVRLETDNGCVPTSIIPTIEWVAFALDSEATTKAVGAREAAIAWFALSCCEGYGGFENPDFWRRVFHEVIDHQASKFHTVGPVVHHSVQFSPDPTKKFPRVLLRVGEGDASQSVTAFLGRQIHKDEGRERNLRRILTQLRPFITPNRWASGLPVAVDTISLSTALSLARDAGKRAEVETIGCLLPKISLVSVGLEADSIPEKEVDQVLAQLAPMGVSWILRASYASFTGENRRWILTRRPSDQNAADTSAPRWCVPVLSVVRSPGQDPSMVCSAVPHLSSVSKLEVAVFPNYYTRPSSQPSDWAWIGYAVFHPDAASQSGLAMLLAGALETITPSDLEDFTNMAQGNNLLHSVTPGRLASAYIQGRIGTSAEIWLDGKAATADASITDTWVSLCVASEHDLHESNWVGFVSPGLGLGWIRASDIVDSRVRQPGKSCIRVLRTSMAFEVETFGKTNQETLLGFLSVLGQRLTTLAVTPCAPLPKSILHAVLQLCPSLKTLHVPHDGSLWASAELPMAVPRLEELRLDLGSHRWGKLSLQQLAPACLQHLRALQIDCWDERAFTLAEQDAVLSFLRGSHMLVFFLWARAKYSQDWRSQTHSTYQEATQRFRRLLTHEAIPMMLYQPLSLDCRVAFLSVFHHQSSRSGGDNEPRTLVCFHHSGRDLVPLIFQFAANFPRRQVHVDQ